MNIKRVRLSYEPLVVADGTATYHGKRLSCSKDTREIIRAMIGNEVQEVFIVLLLNVKNKVIAVHEVTKGSISSGAVKPSDAFRAAIISGASTVIVAHNHPSGEKIPSSEDIVFTSRLMKAGEIVGIQVLDHIIVADDGYFSFLDAGIMKKEHENG
jgi:DNA repair protein RadC